jgi:signal transduction histidine kinase
MNLIRPKSSIIKFIFANALDFTRQTRDIHTMIAVETSEKAIRVSIPTDGMPTEAVNAFVNWLRVEAAARRSHLKESAAWKLSEEVKSDWWSRNESRFIK